VITCLEEEPGWIEGPFRLEARLAQKTGPWAMVVTHPHPLFGGSMDNNVVQALVQAGAQAGLTTLRFNFRGTGRSQGAHDQGLGERDDLLAALDFVTELGSKRLVVAAYSFGAWVAARTDYGSRPVEDQIWVAPPLGVMPLDPAEVLYKPGLILAGGRDVFCPPADLEALVESLGEGVRVNGLERADHFFGGQEARLSQAAALHLAEIVHGGR